MLNSKVCDQPSGLITPLISPPAPLIKTEAALLSAGIEPAPVVEDETNAVASSAVFCSTNSNVASVAPPALAPAATNHPLMSSSAWIHPASFNVHPAWFDTEARSNYKSASLPSHSTVTRHMSSYLYVPPIANT